MSAAPPAEPMPTDGVPEESVRAIDPYIQGMRGLAVAVVVLYHVGAPGFGGGYVGVDIFFVISGFVITRRLVDRAGTLQPHPLRRFYAARIRRLLPTIALVLVTTWVWLCVNYTTPWLRATLREAQAAATGWVNVKYSFDATAYGVLRVEPGAIVPSPFTHFWSLAVEEQFYVVFPIVALLALGAGTRRRGPAILRLVMGLVVVLSIVEWWYLSATDRAAPAFYLLEARAWQLGAGSVLALSPGLLGRLTRIRWVAGTCAVVGPLVALFAVRHYSDDAAMAPHLVAVAAALVMLAASRAPADGAMAPVRAVMSAGPLPALGAISFPLYLWHWPVVFAIRNDLPDMSNGVRIVVAVGVSLALAVATHRWVEHPARFSRRLTDRRTFVAAGVVVVAFVVGVTVTATTGIVSAPAIATVPSVDDALGPLRRNGNTCTEIVDPTIPTADCVLGSDDPQAPVIALVGDSHADQWATTVAGIGVRRGFRVALFVENGCPWMDLDDRDGRFDTRECGAWRARIWTDLERIRPAAVLVASSDRHTVAERGRRRFLRAAVEFADRIGPASRLIVLGDTPSAPFDTVACIAAGRSDTNRCVVERSRAVDPYSLRVAEEAATRMDALFVDTTPLVCPTARCSPLRGNVLVWRDGDHLTAAYAATLVDALDERIGPTLTGGD